MMKSRYLSLTTFACGLLFCISSVVKAKEWTRFRGPNGTGIGLANGIPSKFSVDDADWRVALKGEGHSSPVLWGGRIFVTGSNRAKGNFMVQCLSAKDGWGRCKVVWLSGVMKRFLSG